MSVKRATSLATDTQFPLQLAIVALFLATATVVLGATLEQPVIPTVAFLITVSTGGLWLIARLRRHLSDSRLQKLGYVWLAKLALALFLLYAGWMPDLPTSYITSGYDPQRYYVQAYTLIESDWSAGFVSLNYTGILYYYGILFAVLGHNPVAPAVLNAFVTLLATLLLVRVGYEIKAHREPGDWRLGLAMILPEVLWYDVMTSRETITMALVTGIVLLSGSYWISRKKVSFVSTALIVGILGLGVAAIRTVILLPVLAVIGMFVLLLKSESGTKRAWAGILVLSLLLVVLALAPALTTRLGSYEFEITSISQRLAGGDTNRLLSTYTWSERSFGQLLIPNNELQAILFTLPRAGFYLVTPLPGISVNLSGLVQGAWTDWQALMVTLSSLLNIILFPLAVASLMHTVRHLDKKRSALVFHVPYWIFFFAIAAGNQIIHERYRVMAALLLWGCIWLGWTTSSSREIRKWYLIWFLALGMASIIYILYKFVLLVG